MEADSHLPGWPIARELPPKTPATEAGLHQGALRGGLHLPRRGAWGTSRGPAHLRCRRASMAMVRMGDTRLSVGSALMIACPAEQGSKLPSHPEAQARKDGARKSRGP